MNRRLVVALVVVVLLIVAAGLYVWIRGPEGLGPLQAWIGGSSQQQQKAGGPGGAAGGGPGGRQQPPPQVGVITVTPQEVELPGEYSGRVASFRDVEVRPRVGGLLLSREYEEGGQVQADQVLFRIDPATYQVALDRAKAQLAQAQASLTQAEENYKRTAELVRRQVSSEQQLDQATAQRDQARAAVKLAEAEVEAARLNLDYTVVKAPVSGVTSLQSPAIGTLIQAQQTLLTTITPLDPAYVNFSFTEKEAQDFRELNARRATPISDKDISVELHYGDGTTYPHVGRIDQAARRVDAQTGTIQARAMFPNPDGLLLPGQFVRVVIRGVTVPDALVVPTRAVSQGPQGAFVYVVNDSNVAEQRPIRIAEQVENGWIVRSGLQPGERVVVDGIIRVKPGQPVRPVPAEPGPESGKTDAAAKAAVGKDAGAEPGTSIGRRTMGTPGGSPGSSAPTGAPAGAPADAPGAKPDAAPPSSTSGNERSSGDEARQ